MRLFIAYGNGDIIKMAWYFIEIQCSKKGCCFMRHPFFVPCKELRYLDKRERFEYNFMESEYNYEGSML